MAKTPIVTEPKDQGVGPPPSRPADILLVEIAKIQSDGEYIKRDIGEARSNIVDLRDRLARLETNVSHLPGKGFIIVVVSTALLIGGGIATGLFSLQNYLSSKATPAAYSAPATKSPQNSN